MLTGSIICTGNIIPKIIYIYENVSDRIDLVLSFRFLEYVCVRADWGLGGGACGFLRGTDQRCSRRVEEKGRREHVLSELMAVMLTRVADTL